MTYSLRRREVLQASGLVTAGTFAGCSGSGDDPVYTSIYLRHYANDRLSTDIKVYPWEDDSSEFLSWQTPKLEQQADGPHRVYEDAFETQRAIVDIDAGKLTGDPDIKENSPIYRTVRLIRLEKVATCYQYGLIRRLITSGPKSNMKRFVGRQTEFD
jgi:hypothetical protein